MVKEIIDEDGAIEALEEYNYPKDGFYMIDQLIDDFISEGKANLPEERAAGSYGIDYAGGLRWMSDNIPDDIQADVTLRLVCKSLKGDKDRAVCTIVDSKDYTKEYASMPIPTGIARIVVLKAIARGLYTDVVELDL